MKSKFSMFMKKENLIESYPIHSEWMYDFTLGKQDFRRVKISQIDIVKSIPYFRFENITGYWPIEVKLLKKLNEVGINNFLKLKKKWYENL